MGLFESLLGPIGAIGGSLVSGLFGQSNQEDSQAFSAQQYAHRYQTTVKDMQAAGLNPMLAYTQGPGNSPTSNPISVPDMGASWGNAFSAAAQREQNQPLIDSQVELNNSTANQADQMSNQIEVNTRKIEEEIKNLPTEGMRLFYAAKELMSQYNLNVQKGLTEASSRNLMSATASKLVAETKLLGLDFSAAERLDNLGRNAKELKPAFDILIPLLRNSRR